MPRQIVLLLISIASFLALLLGAVWWLQRGLIYFPTDEQFPVATLLPTAEEVVFTSSDGIDLAGWFVPAAKGSRFPITVLVCNGNGGNRSFRAPLAARLSERGFAVLLWDYRGYGGNAGSPTEEGLKRDARAARDYLLSRSDVVPDRLVYFGESLGSGVATTLAAEAPPAALVLRSPFSSLVDVARYHYPFLPAGLLLRDRFDSKARIARVDCPVLIFAGTEDRIVPPDSSRELFEAVQSDARKFVLIDGADHNDQALLDGDELIDSIVSFLAPIIDREPRGDLH